MIAGREIDQGVRELPPLRNVPVLGIPLALTDYEDAIDRIDTLIASDEHGYICVAATHTVMACAEDPELAEAVKASTFTVPDGQPLVWAMRALGHQIRDRVYGPELMIRHCAHAAAVGTPIFLYGGRDHEALKLLEEQLKLRFPGLRIVGSHQPVFRKLSEQEAGEVAEKINRSGAEVVWVGLGVPRQEKWMHSMRPKLQASVLIGVGAAFDFHAGLIPQAPPLMQTLGLEWLYRLSKEPRRLWRRYFRYNPRFVLGFARQYAHYLRYR